MNDRELKKAIAKEVFEMIAYGVPSNATAIPAVKSVTIEDRLGGPLEMVLRVRATNEHGHQLYHYYRVRVSEVH